jgi:hypothetical protein
MATQTFTWTVLPRGTTPAGGVRFDLHLAPRLQTDGPTGTLGADFPDLVDWPASLRDLSVHLSLTATVATTTINLDLPAVLTSAPKSPVWKALFPATTTVRGFAAPAVANTRIASYPMANVHDFLKRQWGGTAATSPQAMPSFASLISSPLQMVGFEDTSVGEAPSGQSRQAALRRFLGTIYRRNGGAVPPSYLKGDEGVGLAFMQVGDFHAGRIGGTPPSAAPTHAAEAPPAPPDLDFHDVVALTASHGPLQRMLGLVLEFTVAPTPDLLTLTHGTALVSVRATVAVTAPRLHTATTVTPTVFSLIGNARFEAAGRDGGDLERGLLRVGDPDAFAVLTVDPDAGAQSALQFAATLTRSHYRDASGWQPRGDATPDSFALPALRSGGMSVARRGRAALLLNQLRTMAARDQAVYRPAAGQQAADLELHAEDLVRGYRWDVRDAAATGWHSLMRREGHYELLRLPAANRRVPVRDEATVTTAVAAPDPAAADRFLTESMMSWTGWSLAVPPLTTPIGPDGTVGEVPGEVDKDYQFDAEFTVPRGSLPRLRFGHSYRFRARAVDIGNGGIAYSDDDLCGPDSDTITPDEPFLRFEPVEAPTVVLRNEPWPAETPLVVVVRDGHPVSSRHVVPPRTAELMAEWHGVLDTAAAGHPLDAGAWETLRTRDGARLADVPHYPDAELAVPYLPDVLARHGLVRGLPAHPDPETVVDFAGTAWPDSRSIRLDLRAATGRASWSLAGRVLTVGLQPGDVYRLRISCRFDPADLDVLGVWAWIDEFARDWNANHPAADRIDLDGLREAAQEGRLWTLTPAREVTLVHAVRTPLLAPHWQRLGNIRLAGATAALVNGDLAISPRTTGMLDIAGSWRMPIDNGPGTTPDPTVPQSFASPAFSVAVEHPVGAAPDTDTLTVNGRHEFGDHRYRRVAYTAVATTPFVEYFREEHAYTLNGTAPVQVPAGCERSTARLRNAADGTLYQAPDDFVLDPVTRKLSRTATGAIPDHARVVLSVVRAPITRPGPATEVDVLNARRPAPPRVRYVVPTFKWEQPADCASQRLGGGLRVYLERPWWSSGDGERLGVVVLPDPSTPPTATVRPYVTNWGLDPVTSSAALVDGPTVASFPLSDASANGLSLAETPGVQVNVAGHPVAYDKTRDLWYADLRVTAHDEVELSAYLPYVRLALVRFQPNSLDDCHLSTVVMADFVQLVNGRTASVVADGPDLIVTVSGFASTGNANGYPSAVQGFLERRTTVDDPDLGWERLPTGVTFTAAIADGNLFTWTARLPAPTSGQHRLVVQEYERLLTGDRTFPLPFRFPGSRVVYTDILPLP